MKKSCIKDLKMIEIHHFIYMHFEDFENHFLFPINKIFLVRDLIKDNFQKLI